MAAYYHPSPRHIIPSEPTPNVQEYYSHTLDLTDSSTYIFPNPSSEPPSPSQTSDFSAPSDLSYSAISISELDSRGNSPSYPRDYHVPGRATPRQLPWSPPALSSTSWDLEFSPQLDPATLNVDVESVDDIKGTYLTRRASPPFSLRNIASGATTPRRFRYPLVRISTRPTPFLRCDEEEISHLERSHPLLRISLPLLSFFSTLLGIEESTLDLLASPTPSSSIFFPGGKPLHMIDNPDEMDATHGVEKLYSMVTSENGSKIVRRGMLSLEPPPYGLVPLSGFWDLVTEIVTNGGKALRALHI